MIGGVVMWGILGEGPDAAHTRSPGASFVRNPFGMKGRPRALLRVATGLVAVGAMLAAVAIPAVAGARGATARPVVEFDIPSVGVPEGIAVGSDGNLWFTERYTSQLGRMTPAGAFTIFQLPGSNQMTTDITAGPDGALWFTYPKSTPPLNGGQIGRITTSGATTFFTIPWVSDPEAITTGPDGNLWFADHVASALGRVTPAGAITKFPVAGAPGTYPYNVTTGPDGALWFTDLNGHRVGRMTTDGQATFFPVPEEDGYPNAIATGPDGNLWVTLDAESTIARMTTSGTITEFSVPHTAGDYVFLGGIAAGADGALWFTYQDLTNGTARVGRITTAGRVSLIPVPTSNSTPEGIVLGPSNAMWFTEASAGNLGRVQRTGA
jgi:virginiamycin B lyase